MENLIKIESRRYIGSKSKLKEWIFSLIEKHCKGEVFADVFAGTGVVVAEAINKFDSVILNDLLYSNLVSYEAFFGTGKFDKKKIQKLIDSYNEIDVTKLKDNYFSKNFANKYFSKENSRLIGFIRSDIENKKSQLTKKEYSILLTSLVYATDKIANTVGHYDAYIKKEIRERKLNLKQVEPLKVKKTKIYREDANLLARKIKADVVYIDPPYNSRQYSRFYHLLETLVKWEKKELHGVALKPASENMSDYCTVKAPNALADLISNLNWKVPQI